MPLIGTFPIGRVCGIGIYSTFSLLHTLKVCFLYDHIIHVHVPSINHLAFAQLVQDTCIVIHART